ncbi:MAG: thioredoxin domain-containing protein [Magnetococcus sp. YQC-3]
MPRRSISLAAWMVGLLCGLFVGPLLAENRLAQETSPYLARHADSPVAWHPWGEEALARAKREQKLIFLSIGYGACHWCRVMDRESFMDPKTAALLNARYVSIKVDREERPDLDSHFMEVLTAMTGSGGWPLNMILTPALQPVYGGSYFPRESGQDLPSLKSVLTAVGDEWQGGREKMLKRLGKLTKWLAEKPALLPEKGEEKVPDPRSAVVSGWESRFDPAHGGIGGRESKSPQPLILSLLLRHAAQGRASLEGNVALLTLDRMAAGGIRDQLGGAFHRLALDRRWQVPQFDIMLLDNALLARVYLEAYQLTGQEQYALVVREVLEDLLQRLRLPGGCFASALAADSGAGMGKYYTWRAEEIVAILGEARATPFMELFFDPVEGVVEGRSVLRLLSGLESLGQSRVELGESRRALLAARGKRTPPLRDDKELTAWNALLISALAQAGGVLQEESYLAAARGCLGEINRLFPASGQLRHSRRGERLGGEVFLDDYAFLVQALLDLYEADFDLRHLQQARTLGEEMLARFQPAAGHLLQLTPKGESRAVPAHTVWEDGSAPAGNSVALVALQRLALFAQDERLEREVEAIRQGLAGHLEKKASNMPELLRLWDYQPDAAVEVVVVGPGKHPGTQALLREVRRRLLPGLVLAQVEPGVAPQGWPLLAGRVMLQGEPTAYVCRNRVCRLPVNRVEDLVKELERKEK